MPCTKQGCPAVAAKLAGLGITIAHTALFLSCNGKMQLGVPVHADIAYVPRDLFACHIAHPDLFNVMQTITGQSLSWACQRVAMTGKVPRQFTGLCNRQYPAAQPVLSLHESPLDAGVACIDQQHHHDLPPTSPELKHRTPCGVSRHNSPLSLTPRAIPLTTRPSAIRNRTGLF